MHGSSESVDHVLVGRSISPSRTEKELISRCDDGATVEAAAPALSPTAATVEQKGGGLVEPAAEHMVVVTSSTDTCSHDEVVCGAVGDGSHQQTIPKGQWQVGYGYGDHMYFMFCPRRLKFFTTFFGELFSFLRHLPQ